MPSSSSTSSGGKSSTRKITSPASLRNASGRAANARSAIAAISSRLGAKPTFRSRAGASFIGHHDMRRLGGPGLEETDIEGLLRFDGPQRRPGDLLQRVGV